MTLIDAVLLAILQGITEFLPISSSGHLVLGQAILDWDRVGFFFDILVHVGTLGAICLFYLSDIKDVVTGGARSVKSALAGDIRSLSADPSSRLFLLIVLAMVPTGILGLLLRKGLSWASSGGEQQFVTVSMVGGLLIVNGFILFASKFISDHSERTASESDWSVWGISPRFALIIGTAQGLAVLPGFSRAGFTITAALLIGVHRTDAARFSFIISIPTILGALFVESLDAGLAGLGSDELIVFSVAAVVAGLTGYGAIKVLLGTLRKAWFHHFAWYCWLIGAVALFWS